MNLEDLRAGADVLSRDGRKLGTLHRFVIQKDSLTLTHIVIDTGVLRSGKPLWEGGWGLSHDRTVPLAALDHATSERIELTMSAEEFRDHSVDYIEERFGVMADEHPGRLDLSDLRRLLSSMPGEPGPVFMFEHMAKAPDEVDVKRDSPVWRLKPHQKIGEVERVIIDEATAKVTALVIRRGFVFTKDVLLPSSYLVEVVGDVVRVDLDDDSLRALPEFHPDD